VTKYMVSFLSPCGCWSDQLFCCHQEEKKAFFTFHAASNAYSGWGPLQPQSGPLVLGVRKQLGLRARSARPVV
jgi:hypothetical protein